MTGAKEIFMEQREYEMSLEHQILHIEPTKANIEAAANEMITAIKEEGKEPFELLVRMEAVKSFCEMTRKGLETYTREELEKYGKEGYKALKAKFELAETGTKYDYSQDSIWCMLDQKLLSAKNDLKDCETFLKALSKPMMETNVETGEITERVPPTKTSNSSFKISLSK